MVLLDVNLEVSYSTIRTNVCPNSIGRAMLGRFRTVSHVYYVSIVVASPQELNATVSGGCNFAVVL
jgi:hypothetical protein